MRRSAALVSCVLATAALAGCSGKRYEGPGGGPTPVSTEISPGAGRTASGASLATVSAASESQKEVAAPVERVWEVIPAIYEALGIPVTTILTDAREVGNSGLKVRRRLGAVPMQRYLECGGTAGAPNAETYEIQLSVMTRLHDAGEGRTAVVTRIEASGRNPFGGQHVACGTTGNLERKMLEMLAERLKEG
jgi:hypothetical protein